MRYTPLVLIAVLLTWHNHTAYSQSTCAQTLRLAQSVYEQGRLHELPQLLEACLHSGFTDQEKANAYKLLTLTYIYLEEPEKADESMLSLLRTNHEFKVNDAVDPAEFVALYKTFRTNPVYRIGLNIGVNTTQPNVVNFLETIAGSESKFKYKVAFQFSSTADLPINKFLTLNGGIGYANKTFVLTSDYNRGDGNVNSLTAIEKQSCITLPITVQYLVMNNKYNPYVSAGISTDFLLNSTISAERLRENETSIEPKSFSLKPQRNAINLGAVLAVGSKIKIASGFFVAELKYNYGLTKSNNEKSAYNAQDLYLTYGLPNTIFRLNSLSATVAYIQNIYKPKKLTKR